MENPLPSSYEPLQEYRDALDSTSNIFSEQERNEFEGSLKLYQSRSDVNQFSTEEANKIFPALFVIGKSYIICGNDLPDGLKWFSHAMIFGEKADQSIEFALHYSEMSKFFTAGNQPDLSSYCLDKCLTIFNSAGKLDDDKMIIKARILFRKGVVKREANDLDGAAEDVTKAVEILEGLGNPQKVAGGLMETIEFLANVHYHRDDLPNFLKYSKKGLELMDKTLGVDNFKGHNLARELANALAQQRRYDEALAYAKKWENVLSQKYEANDPNMMACYVMSAQILSSLGNYAESLKKLEQAEKVLQKQDNSKDSGVLFVEKARCYFYLENFKEVGRCLDQVIELKEKQFGPQTKDLADSYLKGAEIMKDAPQLKDKAKEFYLKALEIYRNLDSNFEIVSALINFGGFLVGNYEAKEALNLVQEALEICRRDFPARKEMFEGCRSILGMAQVWTGNLREGVVNLEAAIFLCEETGNASGKLESHYFNLAQTIQQIIHFQRLKNMERKPWMRRMGKEMRR